MQECLSTSTMPSGRLNDAPVGQTSTHGGFSQCWHMTGSDLLWPLAGSRTSTFLIHCASVSGRPNPCSPFSLPQAVTHSLQSLSQRLRSISIPHRTELETASSRPRATAGVDAPTPYRNTPGANATPAAAAALPRKLRRAGSNSLAAAGVLVFKLILPQPLPPFLAHGARRGIGNNQS